MEKQYLTHEQCESYRKSINNGLEELSHIQNQNKTIIEKLSPKIDKETLDLICLYVRNIQKQSRLISVIGFANENVENGFISD